MLPVLSARAVDVWLTTGDQSSLLARQPDIVLQPGVGGGGVQIAVDPSTRYQEIEGFGASMTDSSAFLLENSVNAAQQARVYNDLFSTDDGIGLSYVRLAMGSSDFTSQGFFTYNDQGPGQTDPNQDDFSIDRDRTNVIPALQQAVARTPDLRLMGSPWSAPGWMKTSGSVIGGSLRPEFYGSFATYHRKFVEAYAAEGLTIDALTLQNEPLFTPLNYPGMSMTAAEQIDLVANHVGPEFAAAGLDTKLIAYDHNWDRPDYPITVLNDPVARQYLAGSAFHGYAGNVSAQTQVHEQHPDKGIYFTELSGGDFAPDFEDNFFFYTQNLTIGGTRNWAKTALLWNLALDEKGDPHLFGCGDCRGVVTIDSTTGAVTPNEEFYALGHASQFVRPGAVRIDTPSFGNLVETVAFENPDGSLAMLAANPTGGDQMFRAVYEGRHFRYTLPARSVATFVWDPDDRADFDNGSFELGGYHTTGGSLDGWLAWGDAGDLVAATDADALEGEHSLRLAGAGGAGRFAGVSQGITVQQGDRIVADASVLLPTNGSIAGADHSVLMKVEFYDVYGGQFQSADFLGQTQITVADGQTPTGVWTEFRIDELAPAGAVEARLVFVYGQAAGQAGEVLIDAVDFGIAPAVAGDFNGDGVVDAADYTAWRDGIGPQADFADWTTNYGVGNPGSTPPATTAPEPSSLWLIVHLALAVRFRRRSGDALDAFVPRRSR